MNWSHWKSIYIVSGDRSEIIHSTMVSMSSAKLLEEFTQKLKQAVEDSPDQNIRCIMDFSCIAAYYSDTGTLKFYKNKAFNELLEQSFYEQLAALK